MIPKLKDTRNQLLYIHRRKTFILVFVSTAKSIKNIAKVILDDNKTPFNYVLAFKFLQDHIELFFCAYVVEGSITTQMGCNLAIKQILLSNSIVSSNKANPLEFEGET